MVEEEEVATIPIKTYTTFWTLEKKLYSLNDLALPAPIPLRAIGITIAVGIPWWGLLVLFGVPFEPPVLYLPYFIPPVLGFLGTKSLAIFDYKNVFQWANSISRFLFQPRRYDGLYYASEQFDDVQWQVEAVVWQKKRKNVKPVTLQRNKSRRPKQLSQAM